MEKPNEQKNLTPEERTVASLALSDKVKRECKRYRKQFESEWKDYDDAYYGKQHKTGENIILLKMSCSVLSSKSFQV